MVAACAAWADLRPPACAAAFCRPPSALLRHPLEIALRAAAAPAPVAAGRAPAAALHRAQPQRGLSAARRAARRLFARGAAARQRRRPAGEPSPGCRCRASWPPATATILRSSCAGRWPPSVALRLVPHLAAAVFFDVHPRLETLSRSLSRSRSRRVPIFPRPTSSPRRRRRAGIARLGAAPPAFPRPAGGRRRQRAGELARPPAARSDHPDAGGQPRSRTTTSSIPGSTSTACCSAGAATRRTSRWPPAATAGGSPSTTRRFMPPTWRPSWRSPPSAASPSPTWLLLLGRGAPGGAGARPRGSAPGRRPWWPVWLFGAVVFAGVFRADGDVFVLALALLAAACWLACRAPGRRPPSAARFRRPAAGAGFPGRAGGAAGGAAFCAAAPRRLARRRWQRLLAGFLAGVLLLVLVQWWNGGGLHFAATSSFKFTPATGYPAVDFAPAAWAEEVPQAEAPSTGTSAPRLAWSREPRLCGRGTSFTSCWAPSSGCCPISCRSRCCSCCGRGSWRLVLGWSLVFQLLLHGFNFWGGPGPLGNRALLPLYGVGDRALPGAARAAGRPLAAAGAALLVAAPLLLAAPFLYPLWAAPAAWPFAKAAFFAPEPGGAGAAAARGEPALAAGRRGRRAERGVDRRARRKLLGGEARTAGSASPATDAAFLVGSGQPLSRAGRSSWATARRTRSRCAAAGSATVSCGAAAASASGSSPSCGAAMPMWWSPLPMYLYRLEIELPAGAPGAGAVIPIAAAAGMAGRRSTS